MKRRTMLQSLPALSLLPPAAWAASLQEKSGSGQNPTAVYELRVYHVIEGKLEDLLRRFRDHTMKLFEKHGIKKLHGVVAKAAQQILELALNNVIDAKLIDRRWVLPGAGLLL